MHCDLAREHLAERLTHRLPPDVQEALDDHLAECADCRAEAEELSHTWDMLGQIPAPLPDSVRLRARVDDLIAMHDGRTAPVARPGATMTPAKWPRYAAAAAALFAIGLGTGRYTAPAATTAGPSDLAVMRDELRDLRQMVTLTLLQQQSASDRLKGVMWTQAIDQPDNSVTTALLETLMHDTNVNVRLATIDALKRFAERDGVRQGATRALSQQTSPLVQIALIDFLVEAGTREAADALRKLSTDMTAEQAVRTRAADALSKLTVRTT